MMDEWIQTDLSSDPEERWQSAADVARLLDKVPEDNAAPVRRRSPWLAVAALLMADARSPSR